MRWSRVRACSHLPPVRGGRLKKIRRATNEGSGCIVLILGLALTPVLIGIPIIFYGVYLMSKVEKYYVCKTCGQRYE